MGFQHKLYIFRMGDTLLRIGTTCQVIHLETVDRSIEFFSLQKKTQYTAAILLYKEREEGSAIAARRAQTYNGREFLYVEFVFEVAWA